MIRTYSELIMLPSFKERYDYLKLSGKVGEDTFGSRRWLNQNLYRSKEWLKFRDQIILRDSGRDLAMEGFEIYSSIIIHHLNPITYEDILNYDPCVFNAENVVCTQLSTHNAIHYGDDSLFLNPQLVRTKNDTCPWRH